MNQRTITPDNFNLQDYLNHESVFVQECLERQLEVTPHLTRNEFIELHFIGRGYAKAYLDYYCGTKHKPVYEVYDATRSVRIP